MNNHRAALKDDQFQKSALTLHIAEAHNEKLCDKLTNFNVGMKIFLLRNIKQGLLDSTGVKLVGISM